MDVGVAEAMWAAEPVGAVRAIEVLEDGGAGCATIRWRLTSMRGSGFGSLARARGECPARVDLAA